MSIFDMDKNGNSYRWECIKSYSLIGSDFRGDAGVFLSDLRHLITKLGFVPLSTTETRELIELLERTALELRGQIGEL